MSNINQEPYDKNGNPHGGWITYWENGNIFYRGNFVHGIEHGLWERYYIDGRLFSRGYFNMGVMVRYWKWNKEKKYFLCLI